MTQWNFEFAKAKYNTKIEAEPNGKNGKEKKLWQEALGDLFTKHIIIHIHVIMSVLYCILYIFVFVCVCVRILMMKLVKLTRAFHFSFIPLFYVYRKKKSHDFLLMH